MAQVRGERRRCPQREAGYDVVVSDIRLPDRDGDQLFEQLQAEQLYVPPWIFITGYGTVERAIALLKLGAVDYITKPFDLDKLVAKLRAHVPDAPHDKQLPVLGLLIDRECAAWRICSRVSPVRRQQSWSPDNLAWGKRLWRARFIAPTSYGQISRLWPSTAAEFRSSYWRPELFGHERGAFTGAMRAKRGLLEQASGGTLFLDEIGDMPLPMQIKLLRVLQDRKVTRLGSEQSVTVDFRLICATHRDLKKLVEQGTFREDLFYRINVVHLRIPPLRERPEDILWYARRFLREVAQQSGGQSKMLSPGAENALLTHLWPGNVRELRHCIERAYVLTPGTLLDPAVLFDEEQACGECGFGQLSRSKSPVAFDLPRGM